MSTHKIIEVIVSPTGETRVETKGFVGSSCRDVSAALEQALGLRTGEKLKPEFHQSQASTTCARENQA